MGRIHSEKKSNIHITEIPQGTEKNGAEALKIMAEKFTNL